MKSIVSSKSPSKHIDPNDIKYLRNYPEKLKEIVEDNQGRRTEEYDVVALSWIKNARPYRGVSSTGNINQKTKDKLNQLYEKIYKDIGDTDLELDIPYPKELDIQKAKRLKQKEARDVKKEFQTFSTISSAMGFKPPRPTKEGVYPLFPKTKYATGEFTTKKLEEKKKKKLESINYGRERPESIKEFIPKLVDAIQSDSQDSFNKIIRDIEFNPPITLKGLSALMKTLPKNSYYYYALDNLRGRILNPTLSFVESKSISKPLDRSVIENVISETEEMDDKTREELEVIIEDLNKFKRKR
jgi:hypothetical protein